MTRGIHGSVVACLVAGLLAVVGPASADDESVLGQDGGSLILVLDGSGSMKESAGGQTRMKAAQKSLRTVVDRLPDDSKVGLRVYGSTIEDGKGSCEDSELLVPVGDVDKAKLKAGIDKLKPLGNTPIAYSLKQAYKDLPNEGPRSIVLVSDGEENCGGDPCKVARDLKKRGADFYVDVVGLQVDARSRSQLTCVASAGGGTYYDVSDIEDLPSTLTRTSVRAARGYKEAGLPVEGAESASGDLPTIDDGQWLDTIGDTGTEYYELPDPGKGTLHVSASTRTTSPGLSDLESMTISVSSAGGTQCGDDATERVQGSDNQKAPYAVALTVGAKALKECGKGPYVLAVEPPTTATSEAVPVKPLEVFVRTEPAVKTTAGLLGPVQDFDGDEVTAPRASGPATPALGSPSFAGAPPVTPGLYSDTILPGESLLYRIPDVEWGQQPVCEFSLGGTPAAQAALADSGYGETTAADVYGPTKATLTDSTASENRVRYVGKDGESLHVSGPPVQYKNRTLSDPAVAQASLDGDYYCSITLFTSTPTVDEKVGEVPVTLSVAIVGDKAGEPQYASKPKQSASDSQSDDGGVGWGWIVGGLVVLAALIAGLLAAFRRRRDSGATTVDG
jgi:Ca-activated chloride channel family protein